MDRNNTSQGVASVVGSCMIWGLLPIFWNLLAPVNSVYILARHS